MRLLFTTVFLCCTLYVFGQEWHKKHEFTETGEFIEYYLCVVEDVVINGSVIEESFVQLAINPTDSSMIVLFGYRDSQGPHALSLPYHPLPGKEMYATFMVSNPSDSTQSGWWNGVMHTDNSIHFEMESYFFDISSLALSVKVVFNLMQPPGESSINSIEFHLPQFDL